MIHLKYFKESNSKLYGYHITDRKNLDLIKENGLEPRIPKDYGTYGDIKGVYLFKTLDDTKNALMNWLGERIDEWEEETGETYNDIALKIDLTGLDPYLIDSVEFEWICTTTIDSSRIIGTFNI